MPASPFASSSLRVLTRASRARLAGSSALSSSLGYAAVRSQHAFAKRSAVHGNTLATAAGVRPTNTPSNRINPPLTRSMFIQTETTPNEDSLKFIPGVSVMETGSAEFLDTRSALVSPLAIRLMGIEGVKTVFFGPDFVSVSKDSENPWSVIKPEIYSILMEFFSSGQPLFRSQEDRDNAGPQDTKILDTDSDTVAMIKELLDTRVRPAIMEDGGDIEYRGFTDEGTVQVKLKGSCRGCDSSTVTLKTGIERMLMHYIPEVQGVEQILDTEEVVALDEFSKFEQRLSKQQSQAEKRDPQLHRSSAQPTMASATPEKSLRAFVLASRASTLAQIQTNIVLSALQSAFPKTSFSTSFMSTAGDKNQSQALYLLGGKSLWTKELEVALIEGAVDMLVHSLKDVPTVLPEGCIVGAILEREEAADSLVAKAGLKINGKDVKGLDDLPEGSVIGTSSVRRVAQLRRKYPKLAFKDVRGNLNTRLAKLDDPEGPYSSLILAKAGLVRLGFSDRVTSDIVAPTLFHAVGQGALAVEIRADDEEAIRLCKTLTHWQTQWKCLAERACLRVLEGGCSVPVGVHSSLEVLKDEGERKRHARLELVGTITSITGDRHVQHEVLEEVGSPEEAEDVGARLAQVLIETGGREILDEIVKDRELRAGATVTDEGVKGVEKAMEPQAGSAA
ncbi:hypothetical protein EW146_g486 [Bondarzewia mesenterica]|uniref:Porphobilinogen deaminase n=1 Tax=Bondarzewia mesenterica TaxID=1095465 RepID=A0A4S4M774_9AGAM|nr:hypothetical protein EW146_g486 [Bondarzewia mesenterica]